MRNGFRLAVRLPVAAKAIYRAWLDSREHSAMTGARATASVKPGGRFTAWDGYISGRNLKLKPHRCIVQSWRSTEFPRTAPDSRLELRIHDRGRAGSELLLIHSDVPPDQVAGLRAGWRDFYFEPMKQYFAAKRVPERKSARRRPRARKAVRQNKIKKRARRASRGRLRQR